MWREEERGEGRAPNAIFRSLQIPPFWFSFFRDKMEKRPARGGGLKILQGKIDKASERLFPSVRTAEFRVSSCI